MRKTVAFIIFIYNLIGLVAILGISPVDPFYWKWSVALLLFTFPVTIISFAYRYVVSEPIYPVLIIQFIMLAISLFIGDLTVRVLRRK